MGKSLEGPDDPKISEKEHKELAALLGRHALRCSLPHLLTAVLAHYPHISSYTVSPDSQVFTFLAYMSEVTLIGGPLPDILRHSFLYSLHEGVRTFLTNYPIVVEKIKRTDLIKMMVALRLLVLKAVLLSDKFTAKDMQGLMCAYAPRLPVMPKNRRQWEDWAAVLHLDLAESANEETPVYETLQEVDKKNEALLKYFNAQLKCIAKVRQQDRQVHVDWAVSMWSTLQHKLVQVSKVAAFLLTPAHPAAKLRSSSLPKARLLGTKLSQEEEVDEEELVQFWDYICDLRTETKFWESDVVKSHLESRDSVQSVQ